MKTFASTVSKTIYNILLEHGYHCRCINCFYGDIVANYSGVFRDGEFHVYKLQDFGYVISPALYYILVVLSQVEL